jgi:hypothetical protein
MPQEKFETIQWIKKPDWQRFYDDIGRIVLDMLEGNTNTVNGMQSITQ